MGHLLYHCFCRSKRNSIDPAIDVLKGILKNGFFLVKEDPEVPWKDPCGCNKSLQVRQYRLCLTSLNCESDLRDHCEAFGPVGIGFETEFIRALGGFPVFYLPAPIGNDEKDTEDRIGVSLLYRLTELRTIMDKIKCLPNKYRSELYDHVEDIGELEGAIRFLGNILYFTDYTRQTDTLELRYYRQREWRLIAGLTSDHVRIDCVKGSPYYILAEHDGKPIRNFIKEIVVHGSKNDCALVDKVLQNYGMSIRSRLL
ncbi:hypothetical protein [Motiliproteus sp. SC1-56]|uniref:hypothetical protein n=1 Tax=Motiliproteus sp. SC1-56 TaxID=2799565 RepID=UPI001A8F1A02|nr:hypothetical protein [Motiliproteus sp. SC1-56]